MPEDVIIDNESESQYDPVAVSLVDRLHSDIVEQSCVVFLGAGSTTERIRRGKGFYGHVKNLCQYPASEPEPSFPILMEHFCRELDGGNHNRLINEAIKYIESFCIPGEDRRSASLLTNVLASIPYITRFVTTNWDPFLERSLDVLIPMIEDRDLGFWNDSKRQVLKIHGCISRPYSLIATESDYGACTSRNPLIFNKLRDLMATKTFIFTGYSLRDSDFQEIWQAITRSLGRFGRMAYSINPNATDENIEFWRNNGVQVIKTWDLQFFRCLLDRMERDGLIPSRELLTHFKRERERILGIHFSTSQNSDGGFASSMYQDGLLHVLEDIINQTALGTKRQDDFESDLIFSGRTLREAREADDAVDIAYWSGRKEVYDRFCHRDLSPIPAYFHPYRLVPMRRFTEGNAWTEEGRDETEERATE